MSLPNPEALYARLRDQIEKAFPDRSELGLIKPGETFYQIVTE